MAFKPGDNRLELQQHAGLNEPRLIHYGCIVTLDGVAPSVDGLRLPPRQPPGPTRRKNGPTLS
jgi:hypothetical protein